MADEFVGIRIQLAVVAATEELGVGRDHPQRLLEIVRGDIGELLQLGVRACQFLRLGHQHRRRLSQLLLGTLALRHIADNGDRQHFPVDIEWAEANLDRELAAIFPSGRELEFGPHRTRMGIGGIVCAVVGMDAVETAWDHRLDRAAKQFVAIEAEESLRLQVDGHDSPVVIDRHHGIGGRFQEAPIMRLGHRRRSQQAFALRLATPARGDIAHQHRVTDEPARRVPDG